MHLRTLGVLALEGSAFRRQKPLLLLAFLALSGPMSRRRLADLLWMAAADSRDSLSTAIRRLTALGDGVVVAERDVVTASVTCDALEFIAATESRKYEPALECYGGAFLEGLEVPLHEELEEWVFETRERLAEAARLVHLEIAATALARGDRDVAANRLGAALDLPHAPPWDERPLAEAVRMLRAVRSPRVREAERLASEAGLALTVARLGRDGDEALGNLPQVATSFVGRGRELELIERSFGGHARLVTLHGSGGAGKSRLALEAARSMVTDGRFRDGAHFVPLENVVDAAAVAEAIAAALHLKVPAPGPSEGYVMRSLAARQVLLVLDNAEHLAGELDLASTIVRTCPQVYLLVTSRVTLNVSEEHVVRVDGLPVEDSDTGDGALRLLNDRMRQHGTLTSMTPADELAAADLCRTLDGSPLAIELAASLTRVMPLRDVARELEAGLGALSNRDPTAAPRHRNLRAAVEVSWRLLGLVRSLVGRAEGR